MKDITTAIDPADPEEAFAAVVALRRYADKLERQTVSRAIGEGWSWADVAEALGVSRQAAHKRLSPYINNDTRK
ncbi:hypothetical protein [Kordiimonas sp.]|uniref:hypothetical protein n=1 Tax=Kordiimonas sp. TaxID=1970157 RepID=UPI003A91EF41